jgi:signal transduction histidine kinase
MKKLHTLNQFHWKPLLSLLVVLPAVILSYYGLRLYFLTEKEADKTAQTRRLLTEQFPQWRNQVNEIIQNDSQNWISPSEAQFLIEIQKSLQSQSLYLSVDSLIERNWVQSDSFIYAYNYKTGTIEQKFLQKGAVFHDGKYIVNNKKSILGLTHDQTGYLLMLQAALDLLNQKTDKNKGETFFNGNLSINDIIINERVSLISYDKTGKYLIQLSSRLPDVAYLNNNNKVALPQSVYQLMRSFVKYSWMILLSTIITLLLYRSVQALSVRSNRLLSMYDRELHSLKNLLQEVKELTGQIILGKIYINDTTKVLSTLQYNNHTLEKALLFYQNQRYFIGGGGKAATEISNYDLELGLGYIVEWFHSLLSPMRIVVEINVQELEIKGSIGAIELIFHNAIFNAIQAIREQKMPHEAAILQITAQKTENNQVLVKIIDNGTPLPQHNSLDDLIYQSRGNGLRIIQAQIKEIGGKCLGFQQIDAHKKALLLVFKA